MSDVFGNQLGQYVLLELLGEGGMAKVYNALDSRAESNVAIKVILPSKQSSQVFLQQFEREAKTLANLTHTNIVKVLNYGIENGQPYLVMEFIPGGTLKEALNKPLPWQIAATILAPIARALEYVHQQQIVHRDVKPSNILLQDDFRPMLSDFGILKILEGKEENLNAAIGVGVGTPEYMSPEQGMGKEVDFRADIYSLGLVFYEMVTGQKPFTADTPMAVVIKHVTDEMPRPRSLNSKIPLFVEQAIMRAVQKDPARRYHSMGDFAEVLELIAKGEAAPEKKIIALTKEKRKSRRPLFVAALSVLLLASAAYFLYQYWDGSKAQPVATVLASPTPTPRTSNTAISQPTSKNTPLALPTSIAIETPTSKPTNSPSTSRVTLLETPLALNQGSSFTELARWGIGGVNVVRWSPDGSQIALGTTSGIFLYDAQSQELVRFINTQFNVIELAFSPNGVDLAAGSPDGQARAWDIQTGQLKQDFKYKPPPADRITGAAPVRVITYSPNGKNIAIGYENGTLDYFAEGQSEPLLNLDQYPSVQDLAISADNRFIYASNGDKNIYVWDIPARKKLKELLNPASINKLKLSPDRQLLLAGGDTNSVYLWDMLDEKLINSFPNLGGGVTDFDFSFDGKLVAISLNNGNIRIFETPEKGVAKILTPTVSIDAAYTERIRSIAFSPGKLQLASGNWEEGFKLWDAQTGNDLNWPKQSMRGINELHFSKDGNWLATSHEGGTVRIWRTMSAQLAYQFDGYLSKGSPFSPDNRFLAIPHPRGRFEADAIRIVELSSGKEVADLPGYKSGAYIQFTDDSKLLVTGDTHSASIWDVATWEQLSTHGNLNAGCGQYFTPQNTRLAVISDAGILFEYDKNITDMCALQPRGTSKMFYFRSKNLIAFVRGNGEVWIGNSKSTQLPLIQSNTPYPLSDDIFLAGNEASGWYAYAAKGNLLLKNLSGSQGTSINAQDDYQYRVAFLPDKKIFALGSRYGSIHIWALP